MSTKIVIVSGQKFAVPAETENEAIRQQLLAMGFADVASAEIKLGKTEDGVSTIEFVKRAGTKGLTGADLASLLARVPQAAPQCRSVSPARTDLLDRLLAGRMTLANVIDTLGPVRDVLTDLAVILQTHRTIGGSLCCDIDHVPAVDVDVSAW